MTLKTRSKAEILLLVVTFFWGGAFVAVKEGLADASPLAFVAARFLVAAVLLFLVYGLKRPSQKALKASLILGAVLFAGFIFQTWGQEYTTPSKCAFITTFSVVLVPLILALTGAPLKRWSAAGALLGLAGIYLLVAPSGMGAVNKGDVLTLLCAVAFAIYIVLLAGYSKLYDHAELAPPQILLVGLLACVGLPFGHSARWHWTWHLALAVTLTAVFATAFAFAVQNWAQRFVPPAHAALIFALEPVFAVLTAMVMMQEKLGGRMIAGSALILAGIIVSERLGGSAEAADGLGH